MTLKPVTQIKQQTTLTHHHTPAKITPYCKSSRGRENPLPKGDNTPQSLAVFLRPSFFALGRIHIMMVLFGQSLWLVVPLGGILTPSNTVANTVRSNSDGFILQTKGITV